MVWIESGGNILPQKNEERHERNRRLVERDQSRPETREGPRTTGGRGPSPSPTRPTSWWLSHLNSPYRRPGDGGTSSHDPSTRKLFSLWPARCSTRREL